MSGQQPVFDLGTVAQIPARSHWDLEFKLYSPTARSLSAAYAVELAENDVVRFRVWETDGTVIVTATDETPGANGTLVAVETVGEAGVTPATVTVRIDEDDTDLDTGAYGFMLDVQDASDNDRWHPACRGVIQITSAPAA